MATPLWWDAYCALERPLCLDVRPRTAFAQGHLRHAVSIDGLGALRTRFSTLPPRGVPFLVIGADADLVQTFVPCERWAIVAIVLVDTDVPASLREHATHPVHVLRTAALRHLAAERWTCEDDAALLFEPAPVVARALAHLPTAPLTVLDLGCGAGRDLAYALTECRRQQRVCRATGVDRWRAALRRAALLMEDLHVDAGDQVCEALLAYDMLDDGRIRPVRDAGAPEPAACTLDAWAAHLPHARYDAVWVVRFWPRALLRALPQLVRPGGLLVLSHFAHAPADDVPRRGAPLAAYASPPVEHRVHAHEIPSLLAHWRTHYGPCEVLEQCIEPVEDGRPVQSVLVRCGGASGCLHHHHEPAWALDFDGNRDRIVRSIELAKAAGSTLRIGPELEIPGYGCYDHFLERDTEQHSWEVLAELLRTDLTDGILCDVGMPVTHNAVLYNCRVALLDRRILHVRPKMWLANDGNYREMRYFTPWMRPHATETLTLPACITECNGQTQVPVGDALLAAPDTVIGVELCEELFTAASPHVTHALQGAEILINSSGSHHELRKLHRRIELIREATLKLGGVYLYANQRGCDGDRLYYDGCALIAVNGDIVAQGAQFGLDDVEVVSATVDLADVRAHRTSKSRGMQAAWLAAGHSGLPPGGAPRIDVPQRLTRIAQLTDSLSAPQPVHYHTPPEEIALGPACWLWDYLRRSHTQGFLLPLSGGLDSCATAVIVHSMCRLVHASCATGHAQVLADARRIVGEPADSDWVPASPQALAERLFVTCYMGTANSSEATRERARSLAAAIGSCHYAFDIDTAVHAVLQVFQLVTRCVPQFRVHGGSPAENLALQNIQARLRMVFAYLFAQLAPWVHGRTGGLLVLGSANVDETLRGYLTKYDNSAADLNPIGGIAKADLRRFVSYAETAFALPELSAFLTAPPTAELEPITAEYVQSDEADMGMTYDELTVFGRLRKVGKCGPYSLFVKLLPLWTPRITPEAIAAKVKTFFFEYARNRHKTTTLTPAYHAESYSPEDNRFDLRPFLYPVHFPYQFRRIYELIAQLRGSTS
ncbi:NAD(+) synthase (glutamine-hydrolyzing) [Malassezia caprae]|uniref:NAD(+) synthase (glutamine-hydrolyzing) n=1 Tax=Malassezia caprae TaxID=1381934 RepID=A0AAF0ITM9_9BASI|nr:NAD(+) synthase (glutamine-hydrolyzing) [Malassezia caprae]